MSVRAAGLALRDPLNTASPGLIGDKPVDLDSLPTSVREDYLKTKAARSNQASGSVPGARDTFEAAPSSPAPRASNLGPVWRQRNDEPPPEPPSYPPPSRDYERERGRPVDK